MCKYAAAKDTRVCHSAPGRSLTRVQLNMCASSPPSAENVYGRTVISVNEMCSGRHNLVCSCPDNGLVLLARGTANCTHPCEYGDAGAARKSGLSRV